jgi:phosphatidylserine/phosphatidylglycerophosphate/cardiolipin synthase-like enzyme
MSGFGAMAPGGVALAAVAPTFPLPRPAPPSGPGEPEAPCRFAGEPVHWLRVPHGNAVQAFARASRRVYQHVQDGLPDGSATGAALIEVSPLPGFVAGALRQLAGGLPVQYVLLNAADLPLVAAPGDETVVAVEEALLTPANDCWIGVCFQDRVCRDPRAWAHALDAAAQAAGVETTPGWAGFVAAASAGSARVRLLDHVGRPLRAGTVEVSSGGAGHTVTLTAALDGDSGVDVAGGAAQVSVPGAAGAVLASAEADRGAVGQPLALTDTDRHVLVSDAGHWFAQRSAGVTGMERWTKGNALEPLVDGMPYFARLVPELRAAKGGGAVQLAGWAFVKEGLQDPTKPWSLLPEDDTTELVALIGELVGGGASVRLLVNQFLQITDAQLDTIRADAAVVLLATLVGLGITQFAHWTTTDPAGWALLGAAALIIPNLPNAALRDLLRSVAEPSKGTVEAINGEHPGTAVWTPYAAALADNPLAPHPLTIAGVNVELVQHFGVYHQKIAMAQPSGGAPAAFVGGIDINSDRVDDPLHRASAPFHDVQVRLAGPAANEVAKTFAERATYHGTSAPIAPLDDSTAVAAAGQHVVQVGRTYFAPGAGSASAPLPSAPQGEHTTHDTLLQAIANARDYIYIEDQYFTPDTAYVDALVAAADPARGVRALVVTVPERTDQLFGSLRRGDVIARLAAAWRERFRIGSPMRRYLNPQPGTFGGLGRLVLRQTVTNADSELVIGPASRVPTPPFWAYVESELVLVDGVSGGTGTGPVGPQDPSDPDPADQTWQRVTVQRGPLGGSPRWGAKPDKHAKGSCVLAVQIPGIYVHAKLMIADDVFVSVGSSNLNRRGLEHDGEINAFAVPAHLKRDSANPALRLRCQLWAEHLGLSPELGLSLLADPLSALRFFDRSWYRGSRWQPLDFASASGRPAIAIPTSGSVFGQLIGIAEGVVEAAETSTAWAALVDPTTANDPHVDPTTDRGPHL